MTPTRAVREILGEGMIHRCSRYLNNRLEQDHRGIKGRYQPMRGFGSFVSAARFCSAHDEVRDYLRHRTRLHEVVPPGVQREQYRTRSAALAGDARDGVDEVSLQDPPCSCGARCPC